MVWAWSSAGPRRSRHQPTTSRAARWLSSRSVPSHSTILRSGKPVSSRETLPPAVCTSTGTEMAYSLSSTTKTTGSFRLHAVFSASQNSPSEVVPSPAVQTTISSSAKVRRCPRSSGRVVARSPASAAPTACRNCVPVGDEADTMLKRVSP